MDSAMLLKQIIMSSILQLINKCSLIYLVFMQTKERIHHPAATEMHLSSSCSVIHGISHNILLHCHMLCSQCLLLYELCFHYYVTNHTAAAAGGVISFPTTADCTYFDWITICNKPQRHVMPLKQMIMNVISILYHKLYSKCTVLYT